jgi:hypothetical protein
MKRTIILLTTILLVGTAWANERALEGMVQTRIGALEFELGFPTDETVVILYNELDFQRAVQAYIWGLPMVEMAEWKRAQEEDFGARFYQWDFTVWKGCSRGVLRKGEVLLCGTCMDARGLTDDVIIDGAQCSTMQELTERTLAAYLVIVF